MVRLIDADALDAEMYHKSFEVDDGRNVWNSGLWIRYKIFEEAIRDAPTVDAVPVIRCKDCQYWMKNPYRESSVFGLCFKHKDIAIATDETDWCSWAERKEE